MRKVMIVVFALMAIMTMTMPAYAQGGSAAAGGGNWVAIASGFGIAVLPAPFAKTYSAGLPPIDGAGRCSLSSLLFSRPAAGSGTAAARQPPRR